jgi:tetratricopeptide (TPR) repeat protein
MKKIKIIYLVEVFVLMVVLLGIAFSVYLSKKGMRSEMPVGMSDVRRAEIASEINGIKLKIGQFDKSTGTDKDLFEMYGKLGMAQYSLGRLADAEETFKKMLDIVPNHIGAMNTLFSIYRDELDFINAEKTIKIVISLYSTDWNIWRSYLDLERFQFMLSPDELDKLMRQALEKTGFDVNILSYYAKYLEEIGNIDGAIIYWNMAKGKEPKNALFAKEVLRLMSLKK